MVDATSHGDAAAGTADGDVAGDAASSGDDAPADRGGDGGGPSATATVTRRVRRGSTGAVLSGVVGAVLLVRGMRRFRDGARVRGVLRTSLGGVLIGFAAGRLRSPTEGSDQGVDVDASDIVDTGPDVEDAVPSGERRPPDHAGGEDAADVVEPSPDVEDVASNRGTGSESRASDDEVAAVGGPSVDVDDATSDDEAERGNEDDAGADDAGTGDEGREAD